MDFFPYSTQNRQLKISPIAFSEQIAKYLTRQYFHVYSILSYYISIQVYFVVQSYTPSDSFTL